jgi:hypothetical protein
VLVSANELQEDPDGGCIASGQTEMGWIDPVGDTDAYTFYGYPGQGVAIEMAEIEDKGSFWPRLQLYDPNGKRVKDVYGYYVARIEDYQLQATGVYTLVASSKYPGNGRYGLSVTLFPTTDTRGLYPMGPNPPDGNAVSCGVSMLTWQPVTGATGYDVFLAAGACSPLEKIAENLPGASVQVGDLLEQGQYYWQVVAHTPGGDIKGPVWCFSVEPCQGCTLTATAAGRGSVFVDPQGPSYPCGQQVQVLAT